VYDYECKYTPGMAEERRGRPRRRAGREVQRQARLAFDALGLGGYARVDFRMDASGALFCLEANTLPA
jgi:D-alanine-D-alanine ligase